MNTYEYMLFTAALIFIAVILFIIFGQVTVKKLSKNSATQNKQGLEFVSGRDIINVALTLAMPEFIL